MNEYDEIKEVDEEIEEVVDEQEILDELNKDNNFDIKELSNEDIEAVIEELAHYNGDDDLSLKKNIIDYIGMKDTLDLEEISENKLCGKYKDMKKESLDDIEYHHIIPGSVVDNKEEELVIGLSKNDHKNTSTYGGKMNQKCYTDDTRYKDALQELYDQGFDSDIVYSQLLELKEQTGDKYNDSIKEYINQKIDEQYEELKRH